MASKLKTTAFAGEVIEKVHNLLELKNQYFIVARLSMSVGILLNLDIPCDGDSNGKEFNDYTLLSDENGYETFIKAILAVKLIRCKKEFEMVNY